MAFVFKSPKNLELIPNLKSKSQNIIKSYQNKSNNKNKSSYVPFLSNAEKLFEKINENPGPGQYNILNPPDNYIHKKYIKNNIELCKENLNNTMNLVNNFGIKIDIDKTPGPGYYNPNENINFGAKTKKRNTFRNTFLFHQNDQLIKNIIFFNNFENEKEIAMRNNNIKDMTCFPFIENLNNKTNINFNSNKTKKYNPNNNKIFKKILLAYSKLREERNALHIKDKDKDLFSKSFSKTIYLNNSSNSNFELSSHSLKKSNSTCSSTKNKRAKIFKVIDDHERIKKISEEKKSEMKSKDKSIIYLEKYLNSKMFSQFPGPGYYFYKKPPSPPISNNNTTNNEKNTKKKNENFISKIIIENNTIENKLELIPEKSPIKNPSLSKTIYNLKSSFIQQDFKKIKEAYMRNKSKNNNKIQNLIKEKKENNNNKEIQEEGYPIKYKTNKSNNNKNNINNKNNKNNIYNFNSKEKIFIGHSGWENEIIKNKNPGPGEYELDLNTISYRYKNIILLNLLKGFEILKDKKSFFEEIKDTNPPVGTYQPQIVNSIEFKNKIKNKTISENPLKDGFKSLIKARTKKRLARIKLNEKISKSMLGPFSYSNNFNFNKNNSFNNNNKNIGNKTFKNLYLKRIRNKLNQVKFVDKKIGNNSSLDDLRYPRNDWIKKTFNASFV